MCETLHAPGTESCLLSLAGNCSRLQGRQDFPTPEDEGLSDGKTRFNNWLVFGSASPFLLLSNRTPVRVQTPQLCAQSTAVAGEFWLLRSDARLCSGLSPWSLSRTWSLAQDRGFRAPCTRCMHFLGSKWPRPFLHVSCEFLSWMHLLLGSASLDKTILPFWIPGLCLASSPGDWRGIQRGGETGIQLWLNHHIIGRF